MSANHHDLTVFQHGLYADGKAAIATALELAFAGHTPLRACGTARR
jgi:hypothetical protein